MIFFVGKIKNKGFVVETFPGLLTQIWQAFRAIWVWALRNWMGANGVRLAKELFKGFVDIHHQQRFFLVFVWGRGEIEVDERAHTVSSIIRTPISVWPLLSSAMNSARSSSSNKPWVVLTFTSCFWCLWMSGAVCYPFQSQCNPPERVARPLSPDQFFLG